MTFAGTIRDGANAGPLSITKAGPEHAHLDRQTNAFSGTLSVPAGAVVGNSFSLTGPIALAASGSPATSVTFNQQVNGTYMQTISGNGSFTKTGRGTLVLSAARTRIPAIPDHQRHAQALAAGAGHARHPTA